MPEMPQRPREHAIADEAERAFKSLLPSHWIYRPKPTDYGIDGEVELVCADGQLTGRLFYVQLKGTDSTSTTEALAVRLKTTTANYYRALDLPVLIVRYCTATTQLFAKWFESETESLPEAGQDSVSFKLSESDEFTPDRVPNIQRELEGIRLVKFKKISLPVKLAIAFPSGRIRGFVVAELVSAARSLVGSDVVTFDANAQLKVEVGDEQTHIAVGVVHRLTIPTGLVFSNGSLPVFAANVLAAVGLTLASWKLPHAGAALILASMPHNDLLKSFTNGMCAAFCLAADGRCAEALQAADEAVASDESVDLAQAMAMVPILAPTSSKQHPDIYIKLARKIVAAADRQPRSLLQAAARYNLANRLGFVGLNRAAVKYYHSAILTDASYTARSYVWRELGTVLFESGHFRWAAVCYQRAIERGDQECRPFIADALAWAGEYDRADVEFQSYLSSVQYPDSEWVLMHLLLGNLRKTMGLGKQGRNRTRGLQLANPTTDGFDEAKFTAALKADGLSGLAWFNWACVQAQAGNHEIAAESFIAAALCQRNDVDAWCSAIGCAINSHRTDLLAHAIAAAYRTCGEQFFRAAVEFVKKQPEGFPKDQMIDWLSEVVSAVPPKRRDRTVRIVGKETSLVLSTSPTGVQSPAL